jgi:hypothetical protein
MLGLFALAIAAASAALWFRRAMAVRLPASRAGFVAAWVAGALLAATALVQGAGWVDGAAAVLALLLAAFLLFTTAVSGQKVGADAIRLGAALPDFVAPDETGAPFALSSLRGGPILLKFFRGHW